MAKQLPNRSPRSRRSAAPPAAPDPTENGFQPAHVRILDQAVAAALIRERRRRGLDRHDEVWEGVYVMPPMPNLAHQRLVHGLEVILDEVTVREGRGVVFGGANVSDRRLDWETSFRVPDLLVILNNSRAIDCGTHWYGGPDFLVEFQSPGDDTDARIPFYSQLQVSELLIIHRDNRQLQLFRHDGQQLALVEPVSFRRKRWLLSEVVPLAFRRKESRVRGPQTEVQRRDRKAGHWIV